jgi:hypothetical protein
MRKSRNIAVPDLGFHLHRGQTYFHHLPLFSLVESPDFARLELGCGVAALPSLMAAEGGASVCATDLPEAMPRTIGTCYVHRYPVFFMIHSY